MNESNDNQEDPSIPQRGPTQPGVAFEVYVSPEGKDSETCISEAKARRPLDRTVFIDREAPKSARPLHVLTPNFVDDSCGLRSVEEQVSQNWNKEIFFDELLRIARDCGRAGRVHPTLRSDFREIIDSIPADEDILNICDGNDVDGVPGPDVSGYLESTQRQFYGCSEYFSRTTGEKPTMKELFQKHWVNTPKFFAVRRGHEPTQEQLAECGAEFPLLVKAGDSYGSVGLALDSVVHTWEQLAVRVARMFSEHSFGSVICEEFILGEEYSCLVVGDSRTAPGEEPPVKRWGSGALFAEATEQAFGVDIYTPCQRVFAPEIPAEERFLTYRMVWEEAGARYVYRLANDASVAAAVMALAFRAYAAVQGVGLGRVDVRRRASTGEYFVLEVNALPGLGYDSTSGCIMQQNGKSAPYLISRVLTIGNVLPRGKPAAEAAASAADDAASSPRF